MTPRDRMLAALRGQRADRVPIVLPGLTFRTREQIAALDDPHRRELAERMFDQTAYEVGVPSHVNRMLVTPSQRIRHEQEDLPEGRRRTRGTVDTPKGELTFITEYDPRVQTTWQVKYPVETLADIGRIASVPWETPRGLAPLDPADLPDDFPRRGLLVCRISSPMVCVAGMMKYEMFLELCLTDFQRIHELTEVCRVRILHCIDVLNRNGPIEYYWMGGSEWLTSPMGSPALYDALVQEQERSIIERLHRDGGTVVQIHCHGRVRHALARTIERGADYTEPVEPPPDGDITMADAKALAAGRITPGGNVEARILTGGTEDEVETATRAAFEGGKERFILRPSEGPSPRIGPLEFRNYRRMLDVWEELSPIE